LIEDNDYINKFNEMKTEYQKYFYYYLSICFCALLI
jgi:hypothetical protein